MISTAEKEETIVGLYDRGAIGFSRLGEEWTVLQSGRSAPYYYREEKVLSLDLRNKQIIRADQLRLRRMLLRTYAEMVESQGSKGTGPDHLYGVPEAMTTTTAMVGYLLEQSVVWRKVRTKEYGQPEPIKGSYHEGEGIFVLDNAITTGESAIGECKRLEEVGLAVIRVGVMFDREEGGIEALTEAGYESIAYFGTSEAVRILLENKRLEDAHLEAVNQYRSEIGQPEIVV